MAALMAGALLAGCATQPEPVAVQPPAPVETKTPEILEQAPASPPAGIFRPDLPVPPLPLPAPLPGPAPAAPPLVRPLPTQGQARVLELLPPTLTRDRKGWAGDIADTFAALRLAPTDSNVCAAIAVIEQESGFQADPEVPGLSRIAWREIEARRQRYGIPKLALDAALSKTSPTGQTYKRRLDTLRTERQMSALYDDMIAELPGGSLLLSGYNPVRTGGPMQVSVAFAEAHAREKAPRTFSDGDTRRAVFTRRGGVYFGIAHLLDYPAPYSTPLYRFADFNAGHYSSRNAAFQQAVARLTKKPLVLDGDLLSYDNGRPSTKPSATQKAVLALSRRLKLDADEINAGLRQEKTDAFARTPVYQRLFSLADGSSGGRTPREAMPRINLKSPKIQRKLTTEWFAKRVNMRYGNCMVRAARSGMPN
ncbi:MAG: DUF1615 domain-containing protein [Aromatoleum sp.]|uniref:DUF1615 domain-containing protein n=1 Tax=Aromatoleum sp. TaxID=2307007 RepID=UPI002895B7A0|nr:DUF1615 domain-containing protein [Aromatoleum sp.]MDT3668938.1 DUF1615 domain-containing protein [Aromatoleum sp.]